MKSLQIGAGNIGRGFLGHIYFESGFETTFVDTCAEIVALLRERRQYPLRLIGPRSEDADRDLVISRVNALDPRESHDEAVRAIADADIAGTSVGVAALPHIAPLLAAGINRRARIGAPPLNILLCENQQHCSDMLRDLLTPHIDSGAHDYFRSQIGLVETVIGRMVPAPTPALLAEDPLLVAAEPYMRLPLAASMARGAMPKLMGAVLADEFPAYEAQKLFMHNAAHAALAYLGHLNGQTYIWESAQDARDRAVCESALQEVAEAIVRAFPNMPEMSRSSLDSYCEDLLARFQNKRLGDTVLRVAANPIRKLRPSDRLVGAARFCIEHDVQPTAFSVIIAAALRFYHPSDASSAALQRMRRSKGDIDTLSEICGIGGSEAFMGEILAVGEAL